MNEINTVHTRKKTRGPGKKKKKVTRGRTGADLPPALKDTEVNLVAGSREEAAHSSGRPERISLHNMLRLEIPANLMEKGFYHRWFQGKDNRVDLAKAAYYEHVLDEQGNNYTRQRGPYIMYAMRLPQKYRDEDLRLKKERVARTLEEEALIGPNEYAPDPDTGRAEGGTSAVRHHISDSPR